MNTKVLVLCTAIILFFSGGSFAQTSNECAITLSYFIEPARAENYEAALTHYDKVIEECPKASLATYQYAVRMFDYFIGKGDKSKINDLIRAWELRLQHFPERTSESEVLTTIAQLKFDNDIGTKQEQFDAFDQAFKRNPDEFTSGKALYTYFSLAVDLHDEGKKDLQEIFELYDIVSEKIDKERDNLAAKLTPLMNKKENGAGLDEREERAMAVYENNLEVYGTIENSVNSKLGKLADCDNLIPLYEREFESKKDDIDWLKTASNRLDAKECEGSLSAKLAVRLHELEPSATSAYLLGKRAEAEGKASQALKYFNQAAELEADNARKARIYYSIAENYRKKGSFSTARQYYNRMLEVRPSAGIAYYRIGLMYAESTNACGNTVFEKRALNWLAAEMMDKAASVDGTIAANARAAANTYRQRAPQRADIFSEDMAGKTITFNCWVGGSVKVPNL